MSIITALRPGRGRATGALRHAPTDPGRIALHPRDVHFAWADVPLHWIPGEPIASHAISALNLLLPAGERMFVKTFKEALAHIEDPALREDVVGFIGQEAIHAETHDRVLWEYLRGNGVDPAPFARHADFLLARLNKVTDEGDAAARYRSMVIRLAAIAGIEHFTAVLGDWVINTDFEGLDADPMVADLFRWHGAEEVEHRCVAHDVANYFDVGYVRRVVAFVAATVAVYFLLFRGLKFIVRNDPSLPNFRYPRLIVEVNAAMARGVLPRWRLLGPATLRYLAPGYTPEVEGDTAQAVAYLASSPAAKAAASAQRAAL